MHQVKANFLPYTGKENYIFVSYSHEDVRKVIPVLNMLNAKGFRIWYDKGVHVGDKHQKEIAQHLLDCEVFMAFISKAYTKSEYCNNEIGYSVEKKKKKIIIYLQKRVKLSPDLEMNLSPIQAINLYDYTNLEDFYSSLIGVDNTNILFTCYSPPQVKSKSAHLPMHSLRERVKGLLNRLTLRQRIILACSVACAGVILGVWYWRYGWGKDYMPPKPFSAFSVASYGTEAQLQRAITRGADFNVMVSDDTPLYHAAETNPNPDAVRFLIDQTHSLNEYERRERLNKALAIAAVNNQNPEVISVLLEAGAYKGYLSWDDERTLYAPPLFLAAKRNRNPDVTRVLLDAEDTAVRKLILDGTIRYNGKNILMCAIYNTRYTVLSLIHI